MKRSKPQKYYNEDDEKFTKNRSIMGFELEKAKVQGINENVAVVYHKNCCIFENKLPSKWEEQRVYNNQIIKDIHVEIRIPVFTSVNKVKTLGFLNYFLANSLLKSTLSSFIFSHGNKTTSQYTNEKALMLRAYLVHVPCEYPYTTLVQFQDSGDLFDYNPFCFVKQRPNCVLDEIDLRVPTYAPTFGNLVCKKPVITKPGDRICVFITFVLDTELFSNISNPSFTFLLHNTYSNQVEF